MFLQSVYFQVRLRGLRLSCVRPESGMEYQQKLLLTNYNYTPSGSYRILGCHRTREGRRLGRRLLGCKPFRFPETPSFPVSDANGFRPAIEFIERDYGHFRTLSWKSL